MISNSNSFTKLLLDADPFIVTQKTIPKSINKLVGIDSISILNKKRAPMPQISIFVCNKISDTVEKINVVIVKNNSIAKKK